MKVSVITINYNNIIGLQKTFDSVFKQTWDDLEYIVIDGGSNDGSLELIENNQSNIDYWISEKDGGIYNAMNKGIQRALGNYILFINSGDYLVDNNVLTKLLSNEIGDIDLIYGDLKRTFPDGSEDVVPMPPFIDVEQMMNYTLCHPVTLINNRLFKDYGFYDERLKIVADWAFFLKVIVLGNASQKHKNVLVANFSMDGVSSLEENQKRLNDERQWVLSTYLSPAFKKFYAEYLGYKQFYSDRWLRKFHSIMKGPRKLKRYFNI